MSGITLEIIDTELTQRRQELANVEQAMVNGQRQHGVLCGAIQQMEELKAKLVALSATGAADAAAAALANADAGLAATEPSAEPTAPPADVPAEPAPDA